MRSRDSESKASSGSWRCRLFSFFAFFAFYAFFAFFSLSLIHI